MSRASGPAGPEINGTDYYFLSNKEFEEKVHQGDFLEYAEVFGYHYGTSLSFVHKQQEMGKHVFLVIDTQGAKQLKKEKFPAIFVFVSPPSLEELRARLIKRKTESPESLEKRLSWAEKEMQEIDNYDYHVINENLNVAYDTLRSIIVAEEHKVKNERTYK